MTIFVYLLLNYNFFVQFLSAVEPTTSGYIEQFNAVVALSSDNDWRFMFFWFLIAENVVSTTAVTMLIENTVRENCRINFLSDACEHICRNPSFFVNHIKMFFRAKRSDSGPALPALTRRLMRMSVLDASPILWVEHMCCYWAPPGLKGLRLGRSKTKNMMSHDKDNKVIQIRTV